MTDYETMSEQDNGPYLIALFVCTGWAFILGLIAGYFIFT